MRTNQDKFNYYNRRVQEIEADIKQYEELKAKSNIQFLCVKKIEELRRELAEIFLLCDIPDEILLEDEDEAER